MKKFSFICSLILLISLMLTSCAKQEGATVNPPVNQNLLQVKTFTISTDLAADNTSAVGDIYFQKTAEHINVTILASINIGANDWGGVSFYIPKGWDISNILSSYPDVNIPNKKSETVIWSTEDADSPWGSYIEIGHEHNQQPTGGGKGTVLLELVNNADNIDAASFTLMVAVGSEMQNGIPIIGTNSLTIETELPSAD